MFNVRIMKTPILLFTLLGAFLLSGSSAYSQSIDVWSYWGTGTSTSVAFGPIHPAITDAHYAEIGGTNMSDTQVQRWELLFASGYVFGRNQRLTRGADVTEDWDINWSTPAVYETVLSSRWVPIEVSGNSSTYVFKNTGNIGPHPNEPFLGNESIIAMIDDCALFWDSDSTFSLYNLGGGMIGDYTWTTLTGGSLNGMTLSEDLLRQYFIGGEELRLAFLVSDDVIEVYNLLTGNYEYFGDYSGITTGPLAGDVTIADIIDGRVEGWTYLGIDNVILGPMFASFNAEAIPEPGTWAFMLAGAGLLGGWARRRRS